MDERCSGPLAVGSNTPAGIAIDTLTPGEGLPEIEASVGMANDDRGLGKTAIEGDLRGASSGVIEERGVVAAMISLSIS
jgi:hypothetical protein